MIQKVNYRDQVRQHILDRMRAGSLRPDDAVSLVELGRELGVSVTPIREALSQLQYSRIVRAIPNRGFIIPHLDEGEKEHLYRLIATLEHLVVTHATFDARAITALRAANETFRAATVALERINADFRFHTVLISSSRNDYARHLIMDLKTRVFFYELAYLEQRELSQLSTGQHEEIIAALERGDVHRAAELTRENWLVALRDHGTTPRSAD